MKASANPSADTNGHEEARRIDLSTAWTLFRCTRSYENDPKMSPAVTLYTRRRHMTSYPPEEEPFSYTPSGADAAQIPPKINQKNQNTRNKLILDPN